MKAREFGVTEFNWRDGTTSYTIVGTEHPECFIVREVLPIEWSKVWTEYKGRMSDWNKGTIQDLVEKSLRGEL